MIGDWVMLQRGGGTVVDIVVSVVYTETRYPRDEYVMTASNGKVPLSQIIERRAAPRLQSRDPEA